MKYINNLLFLVFVTHGFLSVAPIIHAGEPATVTKAESIEISIERLSDSGVDPKKIQTLTRSMLENQFSQRQVLAANQILLETRQKNLPLDPLIHKANEGMAKKASPDRIIQAMHRVQSRYVFADRQSKNLDTNRSAISSLNRNMVAGLAAGIKEQDMEKISTALQQRKQNGDKIRLLSSNTFSLVKDMARLGVLSNRSTELVVQALNKNYNALQINELKTSFLSLSNDKDANELAGIFAKAIESGKGFEALRDQGPFNDTKSLNDAGQDMDSKDGFGGSSGGTGGTGGEGGLGGGGNSEGAGGAGGNGGGGR